MRVPAALTALLAIGGVAVACSDDSSTGSPAGTTSAKPSTSPPPPADPVADGRKAYLGNCIACHNPDPKLDGALGPAIAGSSKALLEARVVRGEYPEGYTPKRQTRNMVPMPFLKGKLEVLAAYLAEEG